MCHQKSKQLQFVSQCPMLRLNVPHHSSTVRHFEHHFSFAPSSLAALRRQMIIHAYGSLCPMLPNAYLKLPISQTICVLWAFEMLLSHCGPLSPNDWPTLHFCTLIFEGLCHFWINILPVTLGFSAFLLMFFDLTMII